MSVDHPIYQLRECLEHGWTMAYLTISLLMGIQALSSLVITCACTKEARKWDCWAQGQAHFRFEQMMPNYIVKRFCHLHPTCSDESTCFPKIFAGQDFYCLPSYKRLVWREIFLYGYFQVNDQGWRFSYMFVDHFADPVNCLCIAF